MKVRGSLDGDSHFKFLPRPAEPNEHRHFIRSGLQQAADFRSRYKTLVKTATIRRYLEALGWLPLLETMDLESTVWQRCATNMIHCFLRQLTAFLRSLLYTTFVCSPFQSLSFISMRSYVRTLGKRAQQMLQSNTETTTSFWNNFVWFLFRLKFVN